MRHLPKSSSLALRRYQRKKKGLIIPDLPYEHRNFILPLLEDSDIALVPLVSLTTGLERQQELIKEAEGFIYAVAINGVRASSPHSSLAFPR